MAFGGQNKALVLLITESAAHLLLWQQRKLQELAVMGISQADQDLFVAQIRLFPKYPVIIVTDLIDENFRHDTIVHVGGGDRDALMKRKLDFAFRNTRYRIGTVIGRQAEGRKDDRILLSALTKPERIDLWARLLLQERMAVQAVTSIAHLLNSWLALEKLEGVENLLVCKLDADNNLRQSFVKSGRVMFSRLASLTTIPDRKLGIEILQESTQLRQYLERVQFLSYESHLRVLVVAEQPGNEIRVEEYSSELNRFETIDVRARSAGLQIDLQKSRLLPAHYIIATVLQHKGIENLYAPASLTRFSDLRSFGKFLLGSAAALLLLGLGLTLPNLMTVLDKRTQAASMAARTGPLRSQYEMLTRRFPESPAPPREMELVVSTTELIRHHVRTPVAALNLVAESLAMSPGLQLTRIDWALEEQPFDDSPDEFGNLPLAPSPLPGLPPDDALTGQILQERVYIRIAITGEAYSPQSFREAQDQVAVFIAALENHDGVSISSQQLPIDTRSNQALTATINDNEVRAPFSIELALALPPRSAPGQVAGAAP